MKNTGQGGPGRVEWREVGVELINWHALEWN